MNLEKVVFGFFIGELTDPRQHDVVEMFAAIVVNLIATVLKFGDRTQIGAIHLASSLVADLQLIAAAIVWAIVVHVTGTGLTPSNTASTTSVWPVRPEQTSS